MLPTESKYLPPRLLELLSYGVATVVAFGVDVMLLYVLVHYAGLHYLAAAATSFIAGGVVLYFISVAVIFRFRRIPNPALELSYFVALGLVGLALNGVVMYLAVETAGAHYLVAKLAAGAFTFAVNYLLRRYLLFSPPPS